MLLNTSATTASAKSAVHFPRAQRQVSSAKPKCISAPAFAALSHSVPSAPQRSVMAKTAASDKPTILVAEKLGQVGIDMLSEVGIVDCSYDMSPADLCAKISLCDAIVIRSATKVTREVIEASKGRLKVVGRAGVGIDNVDLTAATENGVMVVNAPNANTVAAAEHGVALLCALSRNVAQADASMKKGGWERSKYVGVSLVGKTIAVMGFGKVGADVARRCKGLGMNVISHDPYAAEEKARALNVRLVTFQEAIQTADFISLHMPLTPGTKDLFNKEVFDQCKKGVRIINVARGGVIKEEDLLAAVESGQVAQAALDVFSQEPPKDNPLVAHPNIICTPHLGASTVEAQEGVAVEVADAVVQSLRGELSSNTVNAPMVPPETLKELQPFITLAQGLGKTAVQLIAEHGFSDIEVVYKSSRGSDLDTRLLRANIIKGVLEEITTANVNMVNADLLAEQRGLRIKETIVRTESPAVLSGMTVSIGTSDAKFSGAVVDGKITVAGDVTNGAPYLKNIGNFEVDVAIEGRVLLIGQEDRPGLIAAVAAVLAEDEVNVAFMTVSRVTKGTNAIMVLGIDSDPSPAALDKIKGVPGIKEWGYFRDL